MKLTANSEVCIFVEFIDIGPCGICVGSVLWDCLRVQVSFCSAWFASVGQLCLST